MIKFNSNLILILKIVHLSNKDLSKITSKFTRRNAEKPKGNESGELIWFDVIYKKNLENLRRVRRNLRNLRNAAISPKFHQKKKFHQHLHNNLWLEGRLRRGNTLQALEQVEQVEAVEGYPNNLSGIYNIIKIIKLNMK